MNDNPAVGDPVFLKHLKPVKPWDEFNYHCTCCSDCCKHVNYSVMLEPLDIFNISRYLKQYGNPVWRIEDVLTQYATVMPITDFGYLVFFVKTMGADDSCVFLKSGKCSIHSTKPRTCRMYPLTADPTANNNEGFDYYIITERRFHYNGPKIRVGDWMAENIRKEEREFTRLEIPAVVRIGRLMQRLKAAGVDYEHVQLMFLYHRYFNYDVDVPFMEQYLSNNDALINALSKFA